MLDMRRTERKNTRSMTRFRAPRLDSAGEEVEGEAAELLPRFDLLGAAPVNGDSTASSAGARPWQLGFRSQGGNGEGASEGRERARAGPRWCPYPPRHRTAQRVGSMVTSGSGSRVATGRRRTTTLHKTPCRHFSSPFLFSGFSALIQLQQLK